MTDPRRKVDHALATVEAQWDEARSSRAEFGLAARRRRRVRQQTLAGAGVVLAACVVAFLVLRPAPMARMPDPKLYLADGSTVDPFDSETAIRVLVQSPSETHLVLDAGGARFDVAKRPTRAFRVEAGAVLVEVVGTRFAVERHETSVLVTVTEGQVTVIWPGGHDELGSGSAATFPLTAPPTTPAPAPVTPMTPKAPPAKATWRQLATDGDFDRAYTALQHAGPSTVKDGAADLLLAADTARLSHHPAEALPHLEKVIERHAGDPRAPLAAFTLGRLLLEELGRPREAAAAFADAAQLAPHGAMAEDALAREVEAWSRSGEAARAHTRATVYLERYPSGRRAGAVRRFGGIE